jgi:hypothetical protein
MAIYTTKTPTSISFQKKSGITADDDALHCEIDFSCCARQISNDVGSNKPSEAVKVIAFTLAQIIVTWP